MTGPLYRPGAGPLYSAGANPLYGDPLACECCGPCGCSLCDPDPSPRILRVAFAGQSACPCVDGRLINGSSSAYAWTSGTLGTYDLHVANANNPADAWVGLRGLGNYNGCTWCYRGTDLTIGHWYRGNNTNVRCTDDPSDGVTSFESNNDLAIVFNAGNGLVYAFAESADIPGPFGPLANGQTHDVFIGDTSTNDCPTAHVEDNTITVCEEGTTSINVAEDGTATVSIVSYCPE